MRQLILFVYYLILILAGLYIYFFCYDDNLFFMCGIVLLCSIVLGKLQGIYNYKIIKAFIEIIKLYLYLFLFVYVIYSLLHNYEWLWYVLVCFILLGVYLDDRIKGWRFVIFSVFVLLHFIMIWNGWMNTEILIIKDLFWYSLIMLGGFIWHVLILNWLCKLMCYLDLDYGKYMISRWSLLTSLTIIVWVIQWLIYINYIYQYWYFIYDKRWKLYTSDKGSIFKEEINWVYIIAYVIKILLTLLLVILEYFCIVFQNYSKLILGIQKDLHLFKMPIFFYLFFLLTFMLSLFLSIPRIYIIWIYLFVWNLGSFCLDFYKSNTKPKGGQLNGWLWITLCDIYRFLEDKRKLYRFPLNIDCLDSFYDLWTMGWSKLYEWELIKDYIWYTQIRSIYEEFQNNRMCGVFDFFIVFEYSLKRHEKIVARICMNNLFFPPEDEYEYWIDITKEEFLLGCELDSKEIIKYIPPKKEWAWFNFDKDFKKEGFIALFKSDKIIGFYYYGKN